MNKEELHKNPEYEGVSISLSAEHEEFIPEISQCFDNKFILEGNFYRFSMGELAMQLIIGVAKWVISNVAWDTIKFGIKKFFEKFPNGRATIRHEGIMFVVRPDNSVSPVVTPDLASKYQHIQNVDDLIQFLQDQNQQKLDTVQGWKETALGEVVQSNISSIGKDFNFDEILYLDTGSITENRIESLQSFGISEAPSRAKRLVKEDDIVYSTVRPNQKHFGFIQNPPENLVVSTGFTVISGIQEKIDPKFLYYFLTQEQVTNKLQQIAEHSTSTYPSIKPEHIEDLDINLPPLPEQRAIADMLSSFDDKIELLREQNKTLEATAQTLFQEWFGRYSVDAPDELPEGWRVGKVGTEFDVTIGRTPPRAESEWFSNIPVGKKWISIKDIGNSDTYIFGTSEYLTDEAIQKFNIPIIPQNTTILSFKMTVGKLTITTEEMLSNEAIAHLKVKVGSPLTSEYIYCYLQRLDFNSLGSTSSIVTAINSTMIKELEFIIPNNGTLEDFNRVIKPIFQKIFYNSLQIQTLSKTRDELLPRLMSGEVRLKF